MLDRYRLSFLTLFLASVLPGLCTLWPRPSAAQTVEAAIDYAEAHMTRWEADYVRSLRLEQTAPNLQVLLERCALADYIYWFEEEPFERSGDDSVECHRQLQDRFGAEPEAALYLLEYYGMQDDNAALAADWLRTHPEAGTPLQRARLQVRLLRDAEYASLNPQEAGSAAEQAFLVLPESEPVRLQLVRHRIRWNAAAEVDALLTQGFSKLAASERRARIQLADELNRPKLASALLDQVKGKEREQLDPAVHARIYEKQGRWVEARGLLFTRAMGTGGDAGKAAAALLRLEVEHGDTNTIALAIPLALAKAPDKQKAGMQAVGALLARPAMLWVPPLRGFALIVIPLLLLLMCVPLLPLLWIHHRGLARQLAGKAVAWPSRLQMRHAAWATLGMLWLPALVLLVVHRLDLSAALLTDQEGLSVSDWLPTLILAECAFLLLLTPWMLRQPSRHWLPPQRRWRALGLTVLVGAAVFGLFLLNEWWWPARDPTNPTVMEMVRHSMQQYGLWVTWLGIAVLTPLLEETVFRGILLRASAQRISFGWANFWQALFFALQHEAPTLWPSYVVFGMAAGWLYRRTGSLSMPILMHAVHNSVVLGLFALGYE